MNLTCAKLPFLDNVKKLYVNGFNLTACALVQRKALLERILPKANIRRVRFTDHVTESGERLFEKLEARQLEGMVMERKDSVRVYALSRLAEGSNVCWTGHNTEPN